MSLNPPTVIFVDGENIFLSLHLANRDRRLNIFSLINWLKEKFGPFRMYVYGHFASTKGGLPPFIRKTLENFPNIYVFETNIDDFENPLPQMADQAMIAGMNTKDIGFVANPDLYEHLIIMSGDGSFLNSAIRAQSMGIKVSIIVANRDNLNGLYLQAGFDIYCLDDEKDKFLGPAPDTSPEFDLSTIRRI